MDKAFLYLAGLLGVLFFGYMAHHHSLTLFVKPVFGFLQTIPKGKVVTYKKVAERCGLANPRNVSFVLRQNTDPDKIPCYKVVRADGRLATGYKFGELKEQKCCLLRDGVMFHKRGERVLRECIAE